MQFGSGSAKPAIGVLFDSDVGNRIDSVLALALLYGFDAKNEARTVLVTTSKPNLKSAAFCDAIGKFYAAGGFVRSLPVGMPERGPGGEDTPILKVAESYPNGIKKLNDTAEVGAVIRNAMTAQHDGNCMVILAGPATNLATALSVAGSKEWIEHKVKYLVVSGHLNADPAAAEKVLSEWPGQIVFVPAECGDLVSYPASSIEKDFSYTEHHPIVDAYKAFKPMPYDAPTLDMAAVLYGVRPQEGYFKVSESGKLTVAGDGSVKFAPGADGKHRMLSADPAQKERILKAYTELASAKPVPRARFRPPLADAKKPDEKKPEDNKPEENKPEENKP